MRVGLTVIDGGYIFDGGMFGGRCFSVWLLCFNMYFGVSLLNTAHSVAVINRI